MISFTYWLSIALPRYGKGGKVLEDDGPCPWMFVASWITSFPIIEKDQVGCKWLSFTEGPESQCRPHIFKSNYGRFMDFQMDFAHGVIE